MWIALILDIIPNIPTIGSAGYYFYRNSGHDSHTYELFVYLLVNRLGALRYLIQFFPFTTQWTFFCGNPNESVFIVYKYVIEGVDAMI